MKRTLMLAITLLAQSAIADRMYQVDGKITGMTGDTVTVQSGAQTFEFKRDTTALEMPKDAKVGDRVTVYYSMDLRKVVKKRKQEAGKKAPPQRMMEDDRLFYDARNGAPDAARG